MTKNSLASGGCVADRKHVTVMSAHDNSEYENLHKGDTDQPRADVSD